MTRRVDRRVTEWLIGALIGLFVCAAGAQDALSASAPVTPQFPNSHSWVVIKDHGSRPGRGRAVLVHIAPRTGELPAKSGSAQLARTLDQIPQAVAAAGERVYLAFGGAGDDGRPLVRVRSVRALRQGFGWVFDPPERFTPHPALKHGGEVRSMAAAEGVIVLVMSSDDGGHAAFALVRNGWIPVALPVLGPGARVLAWSTPAGVTIGVIEGGRLVGHAVAVESDTATLGEAQSIGAIPNGSGVFTAGMSVFATDHAHDPLTVSLIAGDSPTPVARVAVLEHAQFSPVFARGPRLLALWWVDPGEADGAPSLPSLHTVEVSLGSGAVLYEGPLATSKFISASEFRMLAMLLFAVVVGVLVIVLRTDPEGETVPLPPGFALAEPSRRVVATGIDLVIAAAIVSLSYGVGFWDLVSLQLLFTSDGSWTAVPATFVVGALTGTLSEWLSGRTIGKVLTGVRVVPVGSDRPRSPRIPLWRSFIRNATKWLLPPVAALASVDNQFRHRGDKMARVIVVIELEAEDEGPET